MVNEASNQTEVMIAFPTVSFEDLLDRHGVELLDVLQMTLKTWTHNYWPGFRLNASSRLCYITKQPICQQKISELSGIA